MDRAILVVDDDQDFRELISTAVEPLGACVLQAATAREAIAVLTRERGRVGLVILDYFLPGMDPPQCARAVAELAGSSNVILCTAAVDPAARAAEVGLTRWLGKPFSLSQLEEVVRDTMSH
jgi:CheY-like chemotaxis protein